MTQAPAAYQATRGSILDVDRAFYARLTEPNARERVDSLVVPIRDGRAWKVPAGHVVRFSTLEGPQVGDLNLWHLHNPRERFWASRTRQLQRAHVSTFDRLWSTLPYLRPMATIIDDTLASYGVDGSGRDEQGGRIHDLLGTRCDPYVNRLLTGEDFDHHCHSNLVRAVLPHGLTEFDVHDVLNVFQCTGLNDDDQYFMKACPASEGDYLELFAEIDLLCALSCCPGGDLSVDLWGPNASDPLLTCHPIGVEVFRLDAALLEGWRPPEPSPYAGGHGLKGPSIDWSAKKREAARQEAGGARGKPRGYR
ncbi:DUF1989 domain-containing protein [Billgrantia antri]|uniref:DUF1989 domain-containing protein n=1 Tax=Halomonas sulfidivorans TaxID=2733488 RepID=A0ABX7WDQ2_9GAMM|nr:DUF1989 domain-containing protein [Halomonas sulfidivorans]QTP58518.1 DUF1989 domain-containing protein [Halomonas sulfidivorans]